jgi:hypothetical protein
MCERAAVTVVETTLTIDCRTIGQRLCGTVADGVRGRLSISSAGPALLLHVFVRLLHVPRPVGCLQHVSRGGAVSWLASAVAEPLAS